MRSNARPARHLSIAAVGVICGILGLAIAESLPASADGTHPVESSAVRVASVESIALPIDTSGNGFEPEQSPVTVPPETVTSKSPGEAVDQLETRLRWAGDIDDTPDDTWTNATTAAVKLFQQKQGIPAVGVATAETVRRLLRVAESPELDARCYGKGVRICVDKQQKVARYLRDGELMREIDVNIGPEPGDPKYGQYSSTRTGQHRIGEKNRDAVSNLYGYSMPFWMQFDGGIGFHYSEYFDKSGYADTSMGCVTIGDKAQAQWLFEHTPLHALVIVY